MHVHRPAQDDQIAPLAMMDYTQDHDWRPAISVSWLNAGIDEPVTLSPAHPKATITMLIWEPGLITQRCSVSNNECLRFDGSGHTYDDVAYASESDLDN